VRFSVVASAGLSLALVACAANAPLAGAEAEALQDSAAEGSDGTQDATAPADTAVADAPQPDRGTDSGPLPDAHEEAGTVSDTEDAFLPQDRAVDHDPGSDTEEGYVPDVAGWEVSAPSIPCQKHQDCIGIGLCLDNGQGAKLCFPWCSSDGECFEFHSCRLPKGYEDAVCLPDHPALCKPCIHDSDCWPSAFSITASCMGFQGKGAFCATACKTTYPFCPPGYSCTTVADGRGKTVERCMPGGEDSCSCEGWMEGAATTCFVKSGSATCTGTRTCKNGVLSDCSALPPTDELCDGKDNNCNGAIDDGVDASGMQCTVEYDSGSCTAQMACVAGEWTCPDIPFADVCVALASGGCTWLPPVADTDADGLPDICDTDDDGDGFPDPEDCAPTDPTSHPGAEETCDGKDNDCNGVSDYKQLGSTACNASNQWGQCAGTGPCVDGQWQCDVLPPGPDHCPLPAEDCVFFPVPQLQDIDKDGVPNFCDPDKDGDGLPNASDNCPDMANPSQIDLDKDGQGDLCDIDDDNDGFEDWKDCCPLIANPDQKDTDGDKTCDACDQDDDNDTVPDVKDNCPLVANPDQKDTDKDGVGDACE